MLEDLGGHILRSESAAQAMAMPADAMPHLTRLRLFQGQQGSWPASVFSKLQSLQLIVDPNDMPCQPANIPGCSTLTELQLCIWPDAFSAPVMQHVQGMASALPKLKSLQLIIPRAFEHSESPLGFPLYR